MLRGLASFLLAAAAVVGPTSARADDAEEPTTPVASPSAQGPAAAPASDPWCPPGVETLAGEICYVPAPAKAQRRTLVIFLHGLTDVGSGWQHAMVRGMAQGGQRWGYAVLAPKGRVGIGPGRKASQIAWPTAEAARVQHEDEIVASWEAARRFVEAREGAAFDEVFVMGFSNGAYYASSLALRGRLDVDGYAVFAGGSAPAGSERAARGVKNRRPVFVGIASRDDTAKKGRELAAALRRLGWPHEASSRPVGHVVADVQLDRALAWLRARVDASRAGSSAQASQPAREVPPSKEPSPAPRERGTRRAKKMPARTR
jgi:predicted esterase